MATLADGGWKHGMQTGCFGGLMLSEELATATFLAAEMRLGPCGGICGVGSWFGDCRDPGAAARTRLPSLPSAPRPPMLSGQASKN